MPTEELREIVVTDDNAVPAKITLPDVPQDLASSMAAGNAVAWSEPLTIKTYEQAEPSKYPMYFDQRVYQGSSGRIYPVPFVEAIEREGHERDWQAVHLENQYVRVVVLPELGGRIHIGYDKTTGYDFFYRNNVIKPALVGLGGPWISGGVEFNWPQHHRPATYLPVETSIEIDDDGTATVWCNDHDPFARMSAQHGVRLRKDSSVVELVVRLHNRTSERQTFLWWANVAARVHEQYQSFFPEDVNYVADHARRALTAFPAADRPYYGVDYPALAAEKPGADRIDFYRNVLVPTSYMIVDTMQDYFGGYDHGAQAGFVHWAERRVSPGKKMWTWGNSPFGHAWDDQLTDGDGPYVELMAGVYTDNQPDFTWLLPGETKVFSQNWYPIPALGPVSQATPDAALSVSRGEAGVRWVGTEGGAEGGSRLIARAAVTSTQNGATLSILSDGVVVASQTVDLVPSVPFELAADVPGAATVELRNSAGRILARWEPYSGSEEEPWVATEPPAPQDIESVDELYLVGVHLAQYRHPTRSPMLYWEEALRRDPGDVRTNTAIADRDYRAGNYEKALERLDLALDRLTRRNWNPQDAEAFYLKGLVLLHLGRIDEAEAALGKAGWDGTWAPGAGLELARLLSRKGQNRAALRVLDTLDGVVGADARRTAVRVVILRRLGREAEAVDLLAAGLAIDPLESTLRVLEGSSLPTDPTILLDVAYDLRAAGDFTGALVALDRAIAAGVTTSGNVLPIAHYAAASIYDETGHPEQAAERRAAARATNLDWAFPSGLEAHDLLVEAIRADDSDVEARYLLGMLLYGHGRRPEALAHWMDAIDRGMQHPVLFRNAALGQYNIAHNDDQAWSLYERALELAPEDARLRYEQDQLAIRLGQGSAERLARIADREELVLTRDDFTVAYLNLLVAEGQAEHALEILLGREFRPWEGGEGQVLAAWDATNEALGRGLLAPPKNLGEARPEWVPPVARHDDGKTDYFATSLPELLLFNRE